MNGFDSRMLREFRAKRSSCKESIESNESNESNPQFTKTVFFFTQKQKTTLLLYCTKREKKNTDDTIKKIQRRDARMIEMNTEVEEVPQWKAFQLQKHSLRISVSDLAACVGFNPFKDLPQLAIDHVYQGTLGQALLRHDAKLLGLRLETEEQLLMEIAQKAGKSTQKALESALKVKKGQKRLANVEQVQNLCKNIVQTAKESKKLSQDQIKQLQKGTTDSVHTGFGTFWESQALDQYEKTCGWPVRQRNEEIRIWRFRKTEDNNTVHPMEPAFSYGTLINETFESNRQQETSSNDAKDTTATVASIDDVHDLNFQQAQHKRQKREHCFFSLRGAIDGIRDELTPNLLSSQDDDDDDSWVLHPVIVECKHRMHRLQDSPPLYEIIQTIAYCQMYQVQEADLVQVLRKNRVPISRKQEEKPNKNTTSKDGKGQSASNKIEEENTEETTDAVALPSQENTVAARDQPSNNSEETTIVEPASSMEKDSDTVQDPAVLNNNNDKKKDDCQYENTQATDTSLTSLEISVNRISLQDQIFQHETHWNSTVLPRLRLWVDAIYTIRASDDKRYRLLVSASSSSSHDNNHKENDNFLLDQQRQQRDAWSILFEECPWLRDCDTRYQRELRL